MKKLRVTVEGKVYEVLVEMLDEPTASTATAAPLAAPSLSAPTLAAAPAAAPKSAAGPAGAGDITSPLAGRIVSVDVQVGQAVAAGAQLATIEAMKMNTYIYAPAAATVKEVLTKAGEAVEEGSVLIRLS